MTVVVAKAMVPEMVVGHISYSEKSEVGGSVGYSQSICRAEPRLAVRSSLHNPPETGAGEIMRKRISRPRATKRLMRSAAEKAGKSDLRVEAMSGDPRVDEGPDHHHRGAQRKGNKPREQINLQLKIGDRKPTSQNWKPFFKDFLPGSKVQVSLRGIG